MTQKGQLRPCWMRLDGKKYLFFNKTLRSQQFHLNTARKYVRMKYVWNQMTQKGAWTVPHELRYFLTGPKRRMQKGFSPCFSMGFDCVFDEKDFSPAATDCVHTKIRVIVMQSELCFHCSYCSIDCHSRAEVAESRHDKLGNCDYIERA